MKFTGERFVPEEALLNDEIGYEHLHRYYAAAGLINGKDVLDLACGEGYGSAIMAKYAASVTGADIDQASIDWANQKYTNHHSNLHFTQASATAQPFADNSFDAVISFETIEHLDMQMQEQFLQEIKRVLRAGGILVMSTPDKKNYSNRYEHENHFHLKEFYREEFISFIQQHFAHTAFFDQGYEIVSIISNPGTEKAESIRLHQWKEKPFNGRKYIIAVASDSQLPAYTDAFASVVPDADKDFLTLMDRLIQMNKEIEGLGQWGQSLDKTVGEKENALQRLQEDNAVLQQSVAVLQQSVKEKELLAAGLNEKIHKLYQESDKVKERLAEIYDSDGWKMLTRYYRLKEKLLPEHSNRYKKIKRLYRMLRGKGNTLQSAPDGSGNRAAGFLQDELPAVFDELVIPEFDFPSVSVIIPAYNAWPVNYQCIAHIISNTQGVAYEVILADDCSTDDTRHCTDIIKNLVHVRSPDNLGFLKNCNHAAGFAKGKYILFLNNDTKVKPNWLSPLVTLAEKDAAIGLVGAKLVYPDGKLQEAGGIIWNDASGWNYGHKQDPQSPEFNYVKEADYISGACILIRKEAWIKAGGFDERYSPAYCEDSDMAFTLRSMGYKVMYQPLAEVIHYEGYSHGTDAALADNAGAVKSYQAINNKKFFEKWKEVLTGEQLPNAQNVFQARDRTTHKKTMLVIDHYVPHFDKDAGSKTTFQYLELFAALNLNIKFLGDNFFKHEPYTTVLQQMGIEVLYGAWYRDNWQQWIIDNSEQFDYIYLNRPHISIKYIDFLKKTTKATILYYGHDLHFLREAMQYEVEKDPRLLKSAEKWKETETYLFEQSDIVLTPSEAEQKTIALLNSRFRVETILPYFFAEPALAIDDFDRRSDVLFVGGFSHQPNLDAVEWFCSNVWPAVHAALPSARFIVVGSNPPEALKKLQNERVEIKGFVSENELTSIYNSVKLVVIPLRYGAGVKGKTVEAMHYGLPVVTSDFGIEGMPGNLDFIIPQNNAAAFATEITRLYNSNTALTGMSAAAAQYINEHFTAQTAARKMKYLLNLTDQ